MKEEKQTNKPERMNKLCLSHLDCAIEHSRSTRNEAVFAPIEKKEIDWHRTRSQKQIQLQIQLQIQMPNWKYNHE